jgi:hypothetical protein
MSTQCRRVLFDLADQTLKPRFVDGQELPDWREGPEILDYIRQMSREWRVFFFPFMGGR